MPRHLSLATIALALAVLSAPRSAQAQETSRVAPFLAVGMTTEAQSMISAGATLWWPSYAALSLDATVAANPRSGPPLNVGLQGRTAPFFLQTGYVVGGVTYDADILRLVGGIGAQFAPTTRGLALEAVMRSVGGNDRLSLLVRKSW